MAGESRGLVRASIRILFDAGTVAGLTDGQLLERFATRRDEGAELAFAALVGRHGPMVLRACRGILRDEHEAMDAFQATFLVLARKGDSLWVRDSIGPWLHRVACRAAGRAKRSSARRQAIEEEAAAMARPRDGGERREELAAAIHEEVDRLPERYRAAVVLCDLEGRTCEEAARHLGCPVGTVASRLSRGRQRLRDRLCRRGLAPRAGLPALAARWQEPPEPIPPEHAVATAGAAARFVTIQAAPRGGAASLAQGVLRSMTLIHWWKMAAVLLAVGASTTGVVSLTGREAAVAQAGPDDAPRPADADGIAVTEVKPGTLSVVVKRAGIVEAARTSDVFCKVEGPTTIVSIVPDGTRVAKGQLVCELDSTALKELCTQQAAELKQAEAEYATARLSREVAEIAVKEYLDGVYPKDLQAASNEIALARSSIAKSEERLSRTRAARERVNAMLAAQGGAKTPAEIVAALDVEDRLADAEQALDRGRKALETGLAGRDVLEKFTRNKVAKQLRIEVERGLLVESSKRESYEMQKAEEENLRRQIAHCKILAPADGVVFHANDPDRLGRWPGPTIRNGANVQEGQKIFSILDPDCPMKAVVKIPETMVDQVRPGLTARITVNAFPNETFAGDVDTVAPLPDPTMVLSGGLKGYTADVAIAKGIPALRPGMTGMVEILVASVDHALSVPVPAVVRYDNKDHVAVKTPDGRLDWREVTLGLTDGRVVEVKEGLKAGETVALEPAPLLSEEQKRKLDRSPPGRKPVAPAGDRPKAKGQGLISPSVRAKLQTLTPADGR